jgi:hypothetical protein
MASPILNVGQTLKGRIGFYTITKQLQACVWLARCVSFLALSEQLILSEYRNRDKDIVIIKSVNHFCLQNERDILLCFQNQMPLFRPLLDEIEVPPDPPALVLKYLEEDLLHASNTRKLSVRPAGVEPSHMFFPWRSHTKFSHAWFEKVASKP